MQIVAEVATQPAPAKLNTATNPLQYQRFGAVYHQQLHVYGTEGDGLGTYYYRARYYNPTTGRFLSEDPAGFRGGLNQYAYALGRPTNFVDPSGRTVESNAEYLAEWALGLGPKQRSYGPDDFETEELMNSPGGDYIRNTFISGNCASHNQTISYGTFQAYWDTTLNPLTADWSNTGAEVGGYGGASAINNGDGTVTYTIPNTSGTHSFFLHAVPNRSSPTGPMSNIYQTFTWTSRSLAARADANDRRRGDIDEDP